jgi:hypothetical protein
MDREDAHPTRVSDISFVLHPIENCYNSSLLP